ncbi:MAG: TRAP transporter fused permease subunit [Betaproteobacteria bacterium]|nr:TRAP transporter fused permease subunit [Betaproteobacteria bacterium]
MTRKRAGSNRLKQQALGELGRSGRQLSGLTGKLVLFLCVAWALFQLWYASPLPFVIGWGVLNDTEARSLHLGVALFLAFLVHPARASWSRSRVPAVDWAFAFLGAFAGAYFILFYAELATRPGQPNTFDIVTASLGLVLLLEATRRAVGLPMVVLALVFLAYIMLGRYLPDVLAHKGASWERMLSHQWLTTEGVFGVALGVSAGFIFIYVLFGALLDRAGAGNYMMQVSLALLGHLRGGPAKVAVVSSGLNGLISGSSVSNVVSGGIFTIPLMKKAGYSGVKAGAIETMSSVDGQIMPPVMGAAAFLMVEYVGIPYPEICKHAFLPAVLSYISLFYIVHLEALKLDLQPFAPGRQRTLREKALAWALGISSTIVVLCLVYFVAEAAKSLFGESAPWLLAALLGLAYVGCLWVTAQCPDLPQDVDVEQPRLPETWPTVKAGLHFLIPIGVLIWCLMIEEFSPALAAFWACMAIIVLMTTQHVLTAWFRGSGGEWMQLRRGLADVLAGLNDGSRNMIGIAIATGTAGIIVGGITLTGLGLRMTEFVEFVSQGNVIVMLLFTAFVCLVLGLGVPTTANYILVATLMAPVIVELGAQSGLVIPLIAVHLFVFYYGIMGDITPPVGLATFAAAAISGEDAIQTGIQGALYALRTVVLPFVWIFNPQLLLIDVRGWVEVVLVVLASLTASLVFAAATMGWFRSKCRWWEIALLLLATCMLFRPDFFMDRMHPPYAPLPAKDVSAVVDKAQEGERLVLVIEGTSLEGEDITKTIAVLLGKPAPVRERLAEAGLTLSALGDEVRIGTVRFGSRAKRAGVEQGWKVTAVLAQNERPSAHWFYLPALAIVVFVYALQGRRSRSGMTPSVAPPAL